MCETPWTAPPDSRLSQAEADPRVSFFQTLSAPVGAQHWGTRSTNRCEAPAPNLTGEAHTLRSRLMCRLRDNMGLPCKESASPRSYAGQELRPRCASSRHEPVLCRNKKFMPAKRHLGIRPCEYRAVCFFQNAAKAAPKFLHFTFYFFLFCHQPRDTVGTFRVPIK